MVYRPKTELTATPLGPDDDYQTSLCLENTYCEKQTTAVGRIYPRMEEIRLKIAKFHSTLTGTAAIFGSVYGLRVWTTQKYSEAAAVDFNHLLINV